MKHLDHYHRYRYFWLYATGALLAALAVFLVGSALASRPAKAGPATYFFDDPLRQQKPSPLPDYSGAQQPAPRVDLTARGDYRITSDRGGVVQEYRARSAALSGRTKVVDGLCSSACLVLIDSSTCATPRGVLGFHAARWKTTGLVVREETELLLASYPPRLQQAIRARGGMGDRMKFIRAQLVLPACP